MANRRRVLGWSAAGLVPATALAADWSWAGGGERSRREPRQRDLCLTVALPSCASECGDLRLAHALPVVRMMNQAKAPVFLYDSEQASPHPVVDAAERGKSAGPCPSKMS